MAESNISQYFDDVAQSLMSNYRRLELLIPNTSTKKNSEELKGGSDHTGEEGRFLENVIRVFLNRHLPKNLRALSGFILRPAALVGDNDTRRLRDQKTDKHSPQLDIIVYDVGNYPVFEQFEDFAIVPPEGVYAIISIKKRLRMSDINHELNALSYSASLCSHYNRMDAAKVKGFPPNQRVSGPVTALIGFKASFELNESNAKKLFGKINTIQGGLPADGLVNLVSAIEQFSFFKGDVRFNDESNNYRVPYLWLNHKIGDEAPKLNLTLQYLLHFILKLYYHSTRQPLLMKPGFNHFDLKARETKNFGGKIVVSEKHFLSDFEYKEEEKKEEEDDEDVDTVHD